MNILITGSTGFVGKNILVNLSNHTLTEIDKKMLFRNDLQIYFNKCDIVIHLAGKAHDIKNTSIPNEYYKTNTDLTKRVFDLFLNSNAKKFIILSSVKAAADRIDKVLDETIIPRPISHYGKSKLLAEQYILSKEIDSDKKVYILRPCMIHGPGNKGNLNLLFKIVFKGYPWPLGSFENKRSFCSIDNLCFIIKELIENDKIPSGIYNIADDDPLSTNELIKLISDSQGKKSMIWNTPKLLIRTFSKLGDLLKLPLNTESLNKLTETYIVSNGKIKQAICKPLPVSAKEGLMKTFNTFNNA